MRILLVGHGKMGRMVESLAKDYDCEVAGVIDPVSPSHGGGPDDDRWRGVDVAVDFTSPDAVMIRAPTKAIAPSGVSVFAVKLMFTPFASG